MVLNADTKIQLQVLTVSLGITEDDGYTSLGITPSDIEGVVAGGRASALLTACDSVRARFDAPADLWRWSTS